MSSKLNDLPATTTPADDDILYIVTGPTTAPADRKTTKAHLLAALAARVAALEGVDNATQTELNDAVAALAADIDTEETARADADALLIPLTQKAAPSGVASLDGTGKVPTAQLPALALTDVSVVADIAARDALTVEEGDVAVVLNAGAGQPRSYIYDGAAWQELQAPTDAVQSVDGRTGAVTLADLYDAAGAATGAVTAHEAAADPHPGYLTEAAAAGTYDAHTERFVGATQLNGAPPLSTAASYFPVRLFDATALETVVGTVEDIPSHWTTFDVDLVWGNPGTTSGDVVWRVDIITGGHDGDLMDSNSASFGSNTTDSAPTTAHQAAVVTTNADVAVPAAGKFIGFRVNRRASEAADTLAVDAELFGLVLRKAS